MCDQDNLNTLNNQPDKAHERRKQIDNIIHRAFELRFSNTQEAIQDCLQAYTLSLSGHGHDIYYDGLIESLLIRGYCFQLTGNYKESILLCEDALIFAKQQENPLLLAQSHVRVAQGYSRIGEYPIAYENLQKAEMILREVEDPMILLMVKQSLAVLFTELGQFERSLEENHSALQLALTHNFIEIEYVVRNNLSDTYLKSGHYDKAIEFGCQVIDYIQESNTYFLKSFVGSILSLAYLKKGDLDKAELYANLFFADIQANNDKKGLVMAHQARARLAQIKGEFQYAVEASKQAVEIAKEILARDDEYENLEILAEIYEETGEYRTALEYYQEAQRIKQFIFNRNATHRIQIQNITYQNEKAKTEAEIFYLKSLELESKISEKTISLSKRTNELKESLKREIQLAEKLKKALERAEHLSQLKTQIIETVSHEFRTPLTVMNTSSELLRHYSERLTEEKKEKHLRHIQESVRYLTEILNETIFIGQMSQYPITPTYQRYQERTFCNELINSVYQSLGSESRIEIICHSSQSDEKEAVVADISLIHRATVNLLTNAIKYSDDPSSVVALIKFDDESIIIEVIDCGIGVPLEEQENIFELFYRAENARVHRGVGFGLHIAKQICDVLSADISVQSEGEGQGSVFRMRFPKRPQSVPNWSQEF
ncbi:MAG: ATP-binding protein [Chloroflexota bacterium]